MTPKVGPQTPIRVNRRGSKEVSLGHQGGNWSTGQLADTPTRGLPTRGLDKSRTGQLAVSQMPPKRKTMHANSPMASASCPVTTRVGFPSSVP